MSARLSAGFPRACSGAMYTAVPMMRPVSVAAGWRAVGEWDGSRRSIRFHHLGQPEVEHFNDAVRADLDVGGLQIPMHDAALVRRFECVGDLARNRQRFVERHAAARDPIGERRTSTNSSTRACTAGLRGFFEPVNRRDVRMVQSGQDVRFTPEAGHAIGIEREGVRQDLERDVAIQRGIAGAIHLAHPADAERRQKS